MLNLRYFFLVMATLPQKIRLRSYRAENILITDLYVKLVCSFRMSNFRLIQINISKREADFRSIPHVWFTKKAISVVLY